ncbi:unnamed protein product [Gongylonema pulchrum]|uniref:G-protein coupled receptors family 1 profile domain-containing protein n=1 Tax=Gongylonema pulchrum TaxID=637853 RepID=A0A3P7PQC4_9BILA|nr:unnamed protein product [Gongylonema pulchrum]
MLKINLNISDLLILVVLAVGKFFWLMTYSWRGGDILCRLFNFLSMIALYISSNIVVCIAFDRFRNVLGAAQIKRSRSLSTVHIMITISWLLAIMWSVPQLWVWKTLDVYPDYPGGWVLVFWGPLLLLVISYAFIAIRLIQYSKKDPCRSVSSVIFR